MHILISILLLAMGDSEAVPGQKLTCPYELKHRRLLRVWCRRSSAECCTGLAFSQNARLVDGGKLKVTQDSRSFTVEVLEPSHREGVYWCGLLSRNDTIIKLAEGYLQSSSGAYIWSLTRWILLPLLPIVTTFTFLYTRITTKHLRKKAERPYDDVAASKALTDPQYDNIAPSREQE